MCTGQQFGATAVTLTSQGLNVITFRTLLHLGPNAVTFRTLLHLGELLNLGLQQDDRARSRF